MLVGNLFVSAFTRASAQINAHAPALRRNARVLDELDVTLGFAALAAEHGYVRPVMSDEYVTLEECSPLDCCH